ncbi:hypothetical protein CCR81_00060, partial [Halorhodospira halophila]|nr:hypothetical protein [Halorhodospira halophila]
VPGITFRCLDDDDWTMLLVSQAAERVTGYASDELVNNATVSYAQLIHPDDLAGVDEAIAEAVGENRPWEVQYRLRHRDGSLRWVQERGVAVRNAQGDVAHLDGFVLDITEQHRAEQALQAAKERFAGIFEQTGSGVAVYRPVDQGRDFEFIDLNPASERIEQRSRDELIGRTLAECFPGVEEMGLLAALQRVADTGVPEELPLASYQDERITGWRENRIFRLSSGEVVAVYEDRTEIKQAQQESEGRGSSWPISPRSYPDSSINTASGLTEARLSSTPTRALRRSTAPRLKRPWSAPIASSKWYGKPTGKRFTGALSNRPRPSHPGATATGSSTP